MGSPPYQSSPPLTSLMRSRQFYIALVFVAGVCLFALLPMHMHLLAQAPGIALTPHSEQKQGANYAYATFLAGTSADPDDVDADHDHYLVAARLLCYQLLHAPETQTARDIPFLVLVTEDVPQYKRDRLINDGATVIPVDYIRPDWGEAAIPGWRDVLAKLHLWELTQFDRVVFLDADTILTRPIDDIFDDPAVRVQATMHRQDANISDESPLPQTYAFAGVPEMEHEHEYPPSEEHHDYPNINYLNAGFFVFQPSLDMFNYYYSLTQIRDRFDAALPEQNLLNYAHRREGNMPWSQLAPTWNIHYPTMADLEGGVATLHEKWWAPEHQDLAPFLRAIRWRMEGFYEGWDEAVRLRDSPRGMLTRLASSIGAKAS